MEAVDYGCGEDGLLPSPLSLDLNTNALPFVENNAFRVACATTDSHNDSSNLLPISFDSMNFEATFGHGTDLSTTTLPFLPYCISPTRPSDKGIVVDEFDKSTTRRSSSDEEQGLKQQRSRRKAQNRAAQRAFRERKETQRRELEAKIDSLTTISSSLQSENERLKRILQQVQMENKILRATIPMSRAVRNPPGIIYIPVRVRSLKAFEQLLPAEDIEKHKLASDSRGTSSSSTESRTEGISAEADDLPLSMNTIWALLQSQPGSDIWSEGVRKVVNAVRGDDVDVLV